MYTATLIDAVMPQRKLAHDAGLVLSFSLLLGLSAQVAIPLPFTPVPFTLQPLAVLLTGVLLGSRKGAMAVGAYVVEGLLGLPVYAGGAFGAARLVGPTGGYLVGFVLAAALVGFLAERQWDRRRVTTAAAMALGMLVIHFCGALWLSRFVGVPAAIAQGVVPFLAADVVKIALAMGALPLCWKWLPRG